MTRRRSRLGRSLAAVVVAGVGLAPGQPARAQAPSSASIVVVAVPALGFDDVTPGRTPNLVRLADRGATGALSVKTIGRRTDRAGAYATIGAGTRAVAPTGPATSGRAVEPAPPVDGPEPRIEVPDLEAVVAANAGTHQGAEIGALATAVQDRWTTAIIANHDGPAGRDRVAALALALPAAGPTGTVDRGSVEPALTRLDADGTRRTDPDAVIEALDALDGPGSARTLTLVEVGDVAWAEDAGATESGRQAAVTRADALLGRIADRLGDGDALVVLVPTAPSAQEQPTPFLLVAPGTEPGRATSATTRRTGSVTLPDLAPTLVELTGGDPPAAMSGTPITVRPSSRTGAERWATLRAEIGEQRFVDRSAGIFLVTYPIVFAAWALLALLAAVAPLGRAAGGARSFVRWLGLALATTPILTFVVGGLRVGGWGQPAWSAVVWGLGGIAGLAAWRLGRPGRAAVGIAGATWVILVGDIATGGALQFGTPLGNSPTVAGRFAGLGNIAFGLLAASTLVVATAVWLSVGRVRPGRPALLAAAAVFAVAVVVDGAPGLGSDVGGVLTLVPVAAITLWSLAGRAVSWGRAALAAGVTAVVLAVLTGIDLTRSEADQTHLGRLARGLVGGDGTNDVLVRKAVAARDSFVASSLVWVVVCTVLLAGLLLVLDRDRFRAALQQPLARSLAVSGVVLGVLGAALNDSGVMVPAMMASVLVPTAYHWYLAEPTIEPDPATSP